MTKQIILWILGVLLFFGIIIGLNFTFGWVDVYQTKTIGKAKENAKREVFKQSQTYNDGQALELVKLKSEYESTKDSTSRNAIVFTIKQEFGNFDESKLESQGLKDWLIRMRGF